MKRDLVKTIVLMVSIVLVTIGSSLLLNLVTGPKIEADRIEREELAAQQAAGDLLKAFPGATGFEDITATLVIAEGSGVIAVHKETSDKGYVFIAEGKYGMMANNAKVTVGVDREGKIVGILVSIQKPDYVLNDSIPNSYIGQDSTLAGVEMQAQATHSSTAIKNAVSAGFETLAANDLMKAAMKSVEQQFEETLLTLCPTFVKKGQEFTASGNIYNAYASYNDSIVVCYVEEGSEKLFALSTTSGVVTVYKATLVNEEEGTYEFSEATSEYASVVEEVKTYVSSLTISKHNDLVSKLQTLFAGSTNFTKQTVSTLNDCLDAVSFEHNGATYYGFYTKPLNAYDNSAMDIIVVIDSEGKIAKVDIKEFFVNQYGFEYLAPSIGTFDKPGYATGLEGVTGDLITNDAFAQGGNLHISSATCTSLGIKAGLSAAFEVYNSLVGGNN
jgi:hypothetical protein